MKAQSKLIVVIRIIKYHDFNRFRIKYFPITWMFYSRNTNNKINKLHEEVLRLVYDNYTSTSVQLLKKDKSLTVS